LFLASPALASDRTPPSTMPVRAVDRPVTLLEDHFGLEPDLYVTRAGETAVVGIFLGAGYGVSNDMEVGLNLIRLTLSEDPSSGIDAPSGYITYRLLDSQLELAVKGEVEVPVNDAIDFAASVPMRLHVGSLLAVNLEPGVFGAIASPAQYGVRVPAEVRIQTTDHLTIDALAKFSVPNLRTSSAALLQFGGRIAYTLERHKAAFGELRATVLASSLVLGDDAALFRPFTSDWTVLIDATFFLRSDPDEAAPDSPF
jgi:hypothetical protein